MTAYVADPAERRTYIGASEVAAALGLSPWDDPIGVAMEKWGERPPKDASFRMKLGTMIEPLIGDLYRDETGRKLRAGGNRTVRMKGHPWLACHPDFLVVGEPGLVQAKLSDDFGDGVPDHYRVQVVAELAITGREWADLAVLGARAFTIHRVIPEPGEIEDLVADVDDYWNGYIVPGIVPPPSAQSSESLRRKYGKGEPVGKIANDAQVEKLARLVELQERRKAAKEAEDALANEIKAAIASASFLEGGGYKASWSRWESDKVDWKAYAESLREAMLGDYEAVPWDDPVALATWADTLKGIYTTKEPGQRLTVTKKESK